MFYCFKGGLIACTYVCELVDVFLTCHISSDRCHEHVLVQKSIKKFVQILAALFYHTLGIILRNTHTHTPPLTQIHFLKSNTYILHPVWNQEVKNFYLHSLYIAPSIYPYIVRFGWIFWSSPPALIPAKEKRNEKEKEGNFE